MKKTVFVSLIAGLMALTACGGDDEPNNGGNTGNASITVGTTSVVLDGEGGSAKVDITTTHEWGAQASDSWIKVSPNASTSLKTTITISADANVTGAERSGSVFISAGSARQTISVTQAASEKDNPYSCPLGDDYVMVFHDEFDSGSSLDRRYWRHEVQNAGWVNNELQNYIDEHIDGNAVTELRNGCLNINCFKYKGKIYSGRVYANDATGYKYGYFEASIKLPKGKGTWPAFWMMPSNNDFGANPWPHCGEIDIMEEVGCVPNEVSCTIHCTKYNNGGTSIEHWKKNIGNAESTFHTYGVEWTKDYITFYLDGAPTLTYTNDGSGKNQWPFDVPFYPILNLAWGGAWGGMYGVDESALPCTMEIDYLRIFQKK